MMHDQRWDAIGVSLNIAIVEDDLAQAEAIRSVLNGPLREFHILGSIGAVEAALKRRSFDFFLLDWSLPDGTGLDVLSMIRQRWHLTKPVLFLTHQRDPNVVVAALHGGADDYVEKPFHPAVLQARVGALMRRVQSNETRKPDSIEAPPYRLSARQTKIERNGLELTLTPKEFDVAWLIFSRQSELILRDDLRKRVWGHADVPTRTLDQHIYQVRTKLGLDDHGWRLLSIYGKGYRLVRADDVELSLGPK